MLRQEKRAACKNRPGRASEKKEASKEAGMREGPLTFPHHNWVPKACPGPDSYLLAIQRLGGAERAKLHQLLLPLCSSDLRHTGAERGLWLRSASLSKLGQLLALCPSLPSPAGLGISNKQPRCMNSLPSPPLTGSGAAA